MVNQSDIKQHNIKKEIYEWIKTLIIALLIAYLIRTFIFSPYMVDGDSMLNTFKSNERVIVNEIIYKINEPQRGDVIVFSYDSEHDFIKRVIGVAGDTVQISNGQLYINEELVNETYLKKSTELSLIYKPNLTENYGPIIVNDGELFVLGDNRMDSVDSRMLGCISVKDVVGRVDLVYWPISSIRIVDISK